MGVIAKCWASSKWKTPLNRETERKVYFYLALVMMVIWGTSRMW